MIWGTATGASFTTGTLFIAGLLLFVTGVRDDIKHISASIRFFVQFAVAGWLYYWQVCQLNGLYGFMNIEVIELPLLNVLFIFIYFNPNN